MTNQKGKKTKMVNEKNTDELKWVKESQKNLKKAADFSGVKFAYSEVGDEIIKQAGTLLMLMERNFGTSLLKPEVEAVPVMFENLMQNKRPDDYIPVLEDYQSHLPGSLTDLLKAKFTYEKKTHKNQNGYMKTCITGGSGIETAKADWQFAVNSFQEERQEAEATIKEAVYTSRKAHKDIFSIDDGLESRIAYHIDYFSEASEVATALGEYGKSMDKANTALATAFADLLTSFNKNWNLIAAGELKLISENRKDSKDLWTSIKSNYKS